MIAFLGKGDKICITESKSLIDKKPIFTRTFSRSQARLWDCIAVLITKIVSSPWYWQHLLSLSTVTFSHHFMYSRSTLQKLVNFLLGLCTKHFSWQYWMIIKSPLLDLYSTMNFIKLWFISTDKVNQTCECHKPTVKRFYVQIIRITEGWIMVICSSIHVHFMSFPVLVPWITPVMFYISYSNILRLSNNPFQSLHQNDSLCNIFWKCFMLITFTVLDWN